MTVLMAVTGNAFARLEERDGWIVNVSQRRWKAQCLAVDPQRRTRVYVGRRGGGLRRSDDGGRKWTDLDLPSREVYSVAVSPADEAVYAGCEPSALYRSDDGGETWRELEALRAIPSAPTWSFPPRPWTSHVQAIAPSPHDPDVLIVGIELGGLMRSEDGGRTWEDHRPGAQRDVHGLAWHPRVPGRAYEAGGGGTAWSSDGGRTWTPADDGRDRHYTWAVTADEHDPDCWYVSASLGPIQVHGDGSAVAHIYRRRGNNPWERLDGGLPDPLDAMPFALLAHEGRLFAGLADGRLYASEDGGEHWSEQRLRGDRLPGILVLAGG